MMVIGKFPEIEKYRRDLNPIVIKIVDHFRLEEFRNHPFDLSIEKSSM